MSATGLNPIDDLTPHRVSPERLAEFDRLMAQGGIEAVMDSLSANVEKGDALHLAASTRARQLPGAYQGGGKRRAGTVCDISQLRKFDK